MSWTTLLCEICGTEMVSIQEGWRIIFVCPKCETKKKTNSVGRKRNE